MEMSRQRLRPSLEETSTIVCPRCRARAPSATPSHLRCRCCAWSGRSQGAQCADPRDRAGRDRVLSAEREAARNHRHRAAQPAARDGDPEPAHGNTALRSATPARRQRARTQRRAKLPRNTGSTASGRSGHAYRRFRSPNRSRLPLHRSRPLQQPFPHRPQRAPASFVRCSTRCSAVAPNQYRHRHPPLLRRQWKRPLAAGPSEVRVSAATRASSAAVRAAAVAVPDAVAAAPSAKRVVNQHVANALPAHSKKPNPVTPARRAANSVASNAPPSALKTRPSGARRASSHASVARVSVATSRRARLYPEPLRASNP
jgi:hypothetical protein